MLVETIFPNDPSNSKYIYLEFKNEQIIYSASVSKTIKFKIKDYLTTIAATDGKHGLNKKIFL